MSDWSLSDNGLSRTVSYRCMLRYLFPDGNFRHVLALLGRHEALLFKRKTAAEICIDSLLSSLCDIL